MATPGMTDKGEEGNIWVEPVVVFFRVIGLFFDVLTLMLRLLINTLMHDTPHGKGDIGLGGRADDTARS